MSLIKAWKEKVFSKVLENRSKFSRPERGRDPTLANNVCNFPIVLVNEWKLQVKADLATSSPLKG